MNLAAWSGVLGWHRSGISVHSWGWVGTKGWPLFVGDPRFLGSDTTTGCSKSTNACRLQPIHWYELFLSSSVSCEGLVSCLHDFEWCFVRTLEGCTVSIPANKKKLRLVLVVGWRMVYWGGHGCLHANLIPEWLQLGAMLWPKIVTNKINYQALWEVPPPP